MFSHGHRSSSGSARWCDTRLDHREALLSPFIYPRATIGYSTEAFSDSLLGAERLQLENAERLFAAVAIMRVVALRLLELRERLRRHPEAEAAQAGLSPLELEVLHQKSGRALRTVREVALAIGRLGGHLNRTSDGLPGWQTLWRGMNTLHALVEGVLIAPRLQSFG
jgi:hypothetical protein